MHRSLVRVERLRAFSTNSSNARLKVLGSLVGKSSTEVTPGDSAYVEVLITQSKVEQFSYITGDFNPIHLDEEAASQSKFKRRIAQGLLVASAIPAIFATCFDGCVYRSQSLSFLKPVYLNELVRTELTVEKASQTVFGMLVACATSCKVQRDNQWSIVVQGQAQVLIPTIESMARNKP